VTEDFAFDPRDDGSEPVDDSHIPAEQRALLHVIAAVVGVLEGASNEGLRLDVEHDRQTIASSTVITALQEMRSQGLTFGR
jgi:hypothetical protein